MTIFIWVPTDSLLKVTKLKFRFTILLILESFLVSVKIFNLWTPAKGILKLKNDYFKFVAKYCVIVKLEFVGFKDA